MSKLLTKRKGELYNMERRKTVIFVIGVILIVSTFLICHKHTAYQTQLDEVKLKDVEENNMFAIMVKDTDGEYESSNEFPGTGYKLNKEKSGCMDNNNELIPNSLSYDEKEQKVIVNALSDNPVGGMYRYQGTNDVVKNNYICLGSLNETNCEDKSENMYRIIGITEEGNIKVIKQMKYKSSDGTNKFEWNKKYSASDCSGNNCDWPNTDIYKTLNTNDDSFLNGLDNSIKNKIEPQKWYYGDIGFYYEKSLTNSADQTYKIEVGQDITQYYDNNENLIIDQKWKQLNEPALIGLIYLHDYYYQANAVNCHLNLEKETYQKCRDNGWMHMLNNGGSTDGAEGAEWTMTRIGLEDVKGHSFRAWTTTPNSYINNDYLNAMRPVRPVFYLKNDIKLEGKGTTSEPFYIAN